MGGALSYDQDTVSKSTVKKWSGVHWSSKQYGLLELVAPDGCVYIEVRKGMYGLPQARILAHQQLIKHLQPFGYYPCPYTPGL